MKIKDLFGQGRPVFSCEVFPPKKTSPVDSIYKTLDGLKDIRPDFISVTFGAGGSQVNQSTREIASIIQNQYHIPAMAHLTCVNATRGEVTALLAGLKDAGVDMTGPEAIEQALQLFGELLDEMEALVE